MMSDHQRRGDRDNVIGALDLVNPVGAGQGLVGGRWEARFDEARPVGGQALTHALNQHAANLGGSREESIGTKYRRVELTEWRTAPPSEPILETRDAYSSPQSSAKSAMETAAAMADLCVVARTSACRVAGGLVALEDAGPADALSGKRNRGPWRHQVSA